MKQVIIIHGLPSNDEIRDNYIPSPSNNHWFPWIQKQLLKSNILCQTPEMPHPQYPTYKDHCFVMNQYKIDYQTTLIGHSLGGGFILKYLSEHSDINPEKIILVAPWLDPENSIDNNFSDIDFNEALTDKTNITCMYSNDDEKDIIDSVNILKEKLPNIKMVTFEDKGHFTKDDMGTVEFPELLELIVG